MKSTLWRSIAAVLFLWLGCGLAVAQEGKPVELFDQPLNISFVPPAGFRAFDDKQLAHMRGAGIPAKFIYSDAQMEVLIVINTFGDDASEKGWADVKKQIAKSAAKEYTRVEWLNREPVSLKGYKWMRMRYKGETANDATVDDMIDDIYFIDWAGRYVIFTFTAPAKKYESYRKALEQSARTIELSILVNVPVQEAKPSKDTPEKRP
jgi:hypothetical protein